MIELDNATPGAAGRYDVVIVGTGHGGAQAAIALRQRGFAGTIALVGDEPGLPYERPPLSKDYLLGDRPADRLLIRPPAFWSERGVTIIPDTRIVAVDPDAHRLTAHDNRTIDYGALVWAAGGSARRLSCAGGDLAGVHTIRTRADVDALRAELATVARVVVIGGGYIGLEAAAALVTLGKHVTLVEAAGRVLARVAGEALSAFFADEHRRHGVDLRTGATVASLIGKAGSIAGVVLTDGTVLDCDLAIVGIGIDPAVGPLLAAGAAGTNGVDVDAACRTSLPDIFAIGDCAAADNRYAGGARVRLESVQNANDQANVVASQLVGEVAHYDAVPWFWSNQYDLKLQTVGLSQGHDQAVVRGDPATGRFSVVYLRDGAVIALDCVNMTRDYVQGRPLVVAAARLDPAALADAERPLKSLLADG